MPKDAKHYARVDFVNRKRIAKSGPSKGWTRDEVRPWLHAMRNAVAAYHAGASWMHPGQSAMLRMCERNARLTAEVERLRSGLLNVCEQYGDMAAELERLRTSIVSMAAKVRSSPGFHRYTVIADALDALAREDGAG